MTPAATPEALEQALARELARLDGWQDPEALWTDNLGVIARGGEGSPVYLDYVEDAGKLIAGPLAPVLADLQLVTAERDAETKRANGAVIRAGVLDMARSNLSYHYHQALDAATNDDLPADLTLTLSERVTRYRDRWLTATAEAASLRAEVEALRAERDSAGAKVTAYREAIRVMAESHRPVEAAEQRENERLRRHPIIRGTALARAATAGEGAAMLETLAPDREDILPALDTTTLDSCPFCGKWAHTGGYQNSETKIFVYKVICTGCTATTIGTSRDRQDARSLAVKYWQRRAPTPALNREEADRG